MATQGIERELLELENAYWQAMKDKDVDLAMSLTDESCIVTGARGIATVDREAFREMLQLQQYEIRDFKLSNDAKVRMLGEEVAILAYDIHEELTVEGRPVTIDAADASTWVRRDGHWLCALHTESLKGDPFGRDRGPQPGDPNPDSDEA